MTTPQAISQAVRQSVLSRPVGGKKDCMFCKPKGFTFLPLRYAVVCNAPASQWPELTSPLGAKVVNKTLSASRYTVRLLREGYLYVLVERKSGQQWQGYAVTPGGMLAQFPVGNPPSVQVPFTCDLATDGVGASLVSIEKIEEVSAIYMLFSPDVVPVAVLNQRAKDKLGMQVLSPKGLQGQAHTLEANELIKWVAEFKLNKDGAGTISTTDARLTDRAPFARQLYPLVSGPGVTKPDFDAHGQRLTNLVKKLAETKSPAIVLWDPIGIAQELNRWHRALDEQIQALIRPHEWALQTSFQIVGFKNYILTQAAVPPRRDPSSAYLAAKHGINPEYRLWERDPAGWVKRNQRATWSRHESCYDEAARAKLVQQVDGQLKSQFDDAEKRFAELKAWLTSRALLDALAWYATDDIRCGALFEYQVSLCTYALGTSRGGLAMLTEWAKDIGVRPDNLMIRQLLFNQQAAMTEFKTVASKLKDQPDVNTASLQAMVSNIAGTFDKAGAIAALAEGGVAPVGMGGVAAKFVLGAQIYSTIGQTPLQPANGAISKLYAFLLYLRGGAKAYMQGAADTVIGVFDAAYASKAAVPLEQASQLRSKLAQAAAEKKNGNFAALRLGTALALIESWNLALKLAAAKGKGDYTRERWEMYAALTATSGAIAISVANLGKVVGSTSHWIEHLSLSSGMLGGFAASVVAVEAFGDALAAFSGGRRVASYALYTKSLLNAVAAAGSFYVGALYGGPLLVRIGQIIGEKRMGNLIEAAGVGLAEFAERKIASRVFVRLTERIAAEALLGVIGWLLILEQVGELTLLALEDDPMQVWLTRCRFRKPVDAYRGLWGAMIHDKTAGTPYTSQDAEAQEFQKALQALIGNANDAQDSLLNPSRSAPQPAMQGGR